MLVGRKWRSASSVFHQSAFSKHSPAPHKHRGKSKKSHPLRGIFFFKEKFGFFLDNYDGGNTLKIYKIPGKFKKKKSC